MQDQSYPDPAQLRAYARDPMPFHGLSPSDLTHGEGDVLTATVEGVTYRYEPAYINVETAPEEWERVTDVDGFDLTHAAAWSRAQNTRVEEDFVEAMGVPSDSGVEPWMYEAYWILDSITIETDE